MPHYGDLSSCVFASYSANCKEGMRTIVFALQKKTLSFLLLSLTFIYSLLVLVWQLYWLT